MKIGEKIRAIRMSKGLSIRSFARIVNLSYGYISKLEKSIDDEQANINPTIDVLKQICDRSHYDLAVFLQETNYIKLPKERLYSYEDSEILEIVRGLSPSEKAILVNMLKGLKRGSSELIYV